MPDSENTELAEPARLINEAIRAWSKSKTIPPPPFLSPARDFLVGKADIYFTYYFSGSLRIADSLRISLKIQ